MPLPVHMLRLGHKSQAGDAVMCPVKPRQVDSIIAALTIVYNLELPVVTPFSRADVPIILLSVYQVCFSEQEYDINIMKITLTILALAASVIAAPVAQGTYNGYGRFFANFPY